MNPHEKLLRRLVVEFPSMPAPAPIAAAVEWALLELEYMRQQLAKERNARMAVALRDEPARDCPEHDLCQTRAILQSNAVFVDRSTPASA